VRAAAGAWLRAAGQDEPVLVKWPNDVVVGGRKLCGILAESQIRGQEVVAVALGIGLNVGMSGLPNDLAETATSLLTLGVRTTVAESLIADVLAELAPRIEGFLAGGERTVAEFRLHDALIGRRVRVGSLEGVCRGINRSGSLLLQEEKDEKGEEAAPTLREVVAGHVEVLLG